MTGMENAAWYALVVRARYEKVVARNLAAKNYDVFLPVMKTRRRWSDRIKELEVPLFPGYVLTRLDLKNRFQALIVPGVSHIVTFDGQPCPVPESEVASIQAVLNSQLQFEPWPFFTVGQRVRVEYGALYGLEGVIAEIRQSQRLIVSLTLLKRSVAVEIDRDWVVPLQPARVPATVAAR